MKKAILLLIFIILAWIGAKAQDTQPSGLKAIPAPQFFMKVSPGVDTSIWLYKGTVYGYSKLLRDAEALIHPSDQFVGNGSDTSVFSLADTVKINLLVRVGDSTHFSQLAPTAINVRNPNYASGFSPTAFGIHNLTSGDTVFRFNAATSTLDFTGTLPVLFHQQLKSLNAPTGNDQVVRWQDTSIWSAKTITFGNLSVNGILTIAGTSSISGTVFNVGVPANVQTSMTITASPGGTLFLNAASANKTWATAIRGNAPTPDMSYTWTYNNGSVANLKMRLDTSADGQLYDGAGLPYLKSDYVSENLGNADLTSSGDRTYNINHNSLLFRNVESGYSTGFYLSGGDGGSPAQFSEASISVADPQVGTSIRVKDKLAIISLNNVYTGHGYTFRVSGADTLGIVAGFSFHDDSVKKGIRYTSYQDYLNADSLTLMPKQYIDAAIAAGGGVASFATRTGAVVPVAGDYAALTETLTNKNLTSGTNTFPTFNQNTTGSAAKLTTARNINGVAFDGTNNISVNLNNVLTFNSSGTGDASGTTFDGGNARTLSYNSIGAAPSTAIPFTLKRDHTIYTMGDSITANGEFQTHLSSLLGGTFTFINMGVSGNLASGMVARFSEVTNGSAEYVIILGGINDLIQNQTAAQIETSLQAMYTAAHNAGIKVIALNILPFGAATSWTSGHETVRNTVNTWIASTAINVDYKIDIESALWDPSNHTNLNPTYDSGDGLHPNSSGQDVMANTINSGATFTASSSVPTIEFSKDTYIDQNLGTYASPTFKTVNVSNLNVTGINTGSTPGATISSGADGNIGLVVKPSLATQTASLMQIQDEAGNVYAKFDHHYAGTFAESLTPLTDGMKGLLIKEFSATTSANQLEIQDYLGTILWRVNNAGLTGTTGIFNPTSSNNSQILLNTTGISAAHNIADANPAFIISNSNSSATGDILQLKSGGTQRAQFGLLGWLGIGISSPASPLDVHAAVTASSGSAVNAKISSSLTPILNNDVLVGLDALNTFQTGATAISTLGAITAGSGGTNGTYLGVALTGGTGTGATADFTIAGNVVTVVTLANGGSGYTAGDNLTASPGSVTGFSIPVATIALTGVVKEAARFGNAPIVLTSITAPTNFVNGMVWQSSNHLNARLNGVTYQLDQPTVLGTIATSPYTTAGVVHNSVTTGAFTSSFIVDADIDHTIAPTWTGIHTFKHDALGVSPADNIILTNTTAAANGAQQYSPGLNFTSQGFASTGSVSQIDNTRIYQTTTQGTTNSSFALVIDMNRNGAGYNNRFAFGNTGAFSAANINLTDASAFATTSTDGIVSANGVAASSGVPVQYSPRKRLRGTAWTGSASQVADWIEEVQPVNGTTPITSKLVYSSSINGGAYSARYSITDAGLFAVTHLTSLTSAPTIAAGTGAGTSPTVSVSGNDLAGVVSVTTGTTPTGSNAIVGTITFNGAYSVAPRVVLTPSNRNAQALTSATLVLVPASGETNGVTTTTFVIESGATNLTASTLYKWTYEVLQ